MCPGLRRYRPVEPDRSALLLAQQDLGSICTPTFSYAAPAGVELRGCDQLAGIIGLAAECILAALVAELVDCGAGLGGIWPALEIKTMATGEFTDRRQRRGRCSFSDWRFAGWRCWRNCPTGRGRYTTGDEKSKYRHAHYRYDKRGLHQALPFINYNRYP